MTSAATQQLIAVLGRCAGACPAFPAGYLSVRLDAAEPLALDLAVGEAFPARAALPSDLLQVACATKPLLPLLLAMSAPQLLGSSIECDIAESKSDATRHRRTVSVRQLLNHEVGLVSPTAMHWRMLGEQLPFPMVRHQLVASAAPSYSDFAAWVLLEMLFSMETGRDPGEALATDLLQPLGLVGEIDLGHGAGCLERVAVPWSDFGGVRRPLVSELLPSERALCRPAFGAQASCRGIADLYAGLGRVLSGRTVEGLPTPWLLEDLLREAGPEIEDPNFGAPLTFRGGFMTNCGGRTFSPLSLDTLGHSGGFGLVCAGVDPNRGLAFAFAFNGLSTDRDVLRAVKETMLRAIGQWSESMLVVRPRG